MRHKDAAYRLFIANEELSKTNDGSTVRKLKTYRVSYLCFYVHIKPRYMCVPPPPNIAPSSLSAHGSL